MIASLDGRDVIWKPEPKQRLAMEAPVFELLYGGSKGGMKTNYLAACWLPMLKAAHDKYEATGRPQHKCRIVIFRKNLDDLLDIIGKTHEIYPYFDPQMGQDGYHINNKTWTFTSGATVAFRHLDGPEDHKSFNGNEIPGMGFDEVQQIPWEAYSFLIAQCRSGDADYHRMRMVRSTANPGGFDWVAKHFHVNECPDGGRIFRDKYEVRGKPVEITRTFIRSWLHENPYLPPDYEAQLRASMSEDEVAMYLGGDFFRVAGSFFSRLLRPEVHFRRSHPVSSSCDFRFAIDWGSTNPACCLVGAKDADGTVYIIDELHKPGVAGTAFGEDMKGLWSRQAWCTDKHFAVDDFYGVIDKQAMDKNNGEFTPASGIQQWGFRLWPAQKDRTHGCNQIKERLLLNAQGKGKLIIFDDRAPNTAKALSAIPSDAPRKPEEYKMDSPFAHAADALRFLCCEWAVTPIKEVSKVDAEVAAWVAMMERQQQRQNNTSDQMTAGYD